MNSELFANKDHSKLSASWYSVWGNCHAAIYLVDEYKEVLAQIEPTKDSLKGTCSHSLGEVALRGLIEHKVNGSDPDIKFHLLTSVNTTEVLDDDDFEDCVDFATQYRDSIWKNMLRNSITNKAYGFETNVFLDKKLDIGGHIDFWSVFLDHKANRVLALTDAKSGYQFVDTDSDQNELYAVMLREEILRAGGKDFDYALLSIFQPQHEPAYREVKVPIKRLEKVKEKALKAAHNSLTGKGKFKVGPWCEGCKVKGVCVTYAKKLEKSTALSILEPDQIKFPKVETIPPEVLGRLVLLQDDVFAFFKAAKALAVLHATQGKPFPGTKLIATKGRNRWNGDSLAIAQELVSHGILETEVYNFKLKGIGEIEKKLKKLVGKEETEKLISANVVKGASGVQIVSVDDPRPAVTNALDMLADETTSGIPQEE